MCGNAIRSTAKFVYGKGFTSKTNFKIETLGGIKELFLDVKDGEVTNIPAALGAPVLEAALVRPVESVKENSFIEEISMLKIEHEPKTVNIQ